MHTLKLSSDRIRAKAHLWIDRAPDGCVVKFEPEPKRSLDQNSKLWACLGDISKQVQHNGKYRSAESWKLILMHALKYECAFEIGLNGEPFPTGFRSSQLSVKQMSEMIEFIMAFGAENGVRWTDYGYNEER